MQNKTKQNKNKQKKNQVSTFTIQRYVRYNQLIMKRIE
jgi:hypothetical protein